MRASSLYIAIVGTADELNDKTKEKINLAFEDIFDGKVKKISDVKEDLDNEVIYEVFTPVVNDEALTKEFFEGLEILLEELREFDPHFTQIRRNEI